MYLYDEINDKINVYEMIPKEKEIKKFRENELNKCGNIYNHIETVSLEPFNGSGRHTIFYPFKNDDQILDISEVNFEGPIKEYERRGELILSTDDIFKYQYVNNYVLNPRLVAIKDLEKIRYFLLNNKEVYEKIGGYSANISFVIKPILEINQALYNLEKLLERKFVVLNKSCLDKELNLFNIVLKDCISKLEIDKINKYVDSTPLDIINKYKENDKIIIKKVK